MSVLDRKMFKRVARLKHGGDPNIDHETGLPIVSEEMSGIVAGMNEFQPVANTFAQQLFPEKTAEEYAEEAAKLYTTDYGAERAAIAAQKEADTASSLINFGARLLTGRGKALDVLGQAVQQTLPEFTAARRATRKEEAAISTAEKQVEAQRSAYALTKEQEDAVARANIMSQAMFSNLGFFQELAKSKNKNQLNLDSTFKLVVDRATNLNTEITLGQYLKDLELPEDQRKYDVAKDYTQPFVAYDSILKENRFFTTYEEFAVANAADPSRYKDKKDMTKEWKKVLNLNTKKVEFVESQKVNPSVHVPADSVDYIEVMDTKNKNKLVYHPKNIPLDTERYVPKQEPVNLFKDFVMGSFTHPATGEYGNWQMKELKNGTYLIPALDANGDIILQANGQPEWTTIGTGLGDLTVNQKVAMTAEDVLPRKALTEMFASIQLYDRNINSIDRVIANLLEDPSLAGFPGLLQDLKQRGLGMMTDLFAAEDQLALFQETIKDVKNSFKDGLIETAEGSGEFTDVNALFDPNNPASQQFWGDEFKPQLAENRVRINGIAYALARARKDSGRLNLDDIARAYESLKVTGLIDSKSIISALATVREELRLANNDLKVLYKMNKGQFPDGYVTSGEINPQNVPLAAYDPDTNTFTDITLPVEIKP
tara:strand:+ start:978 stop:2942 length:1965 start_codon:yes stop_codon:yes gene_type:complete